MTYSDGASSADNQAQLQALHTGLAALKQKNYPTAIACLEDCLASTNAVTRLKAQMGLIKAYARVERVSTAISLCQPLTEHANSQVQIWATQTLAELNQVARSSQSAIPDATGFTPIASPGSNAATSADATGFTPIQEAPSARQRASIRQPPPIEPHAQPINQPTLNQPAVNQPAASQSAANQPEPAQPDTSSSRTGQTEQTANLSRSVPLWRNADRVQRWSTLGRADASGLWALQAGSLVLLFWLVRALFRVLSDSINEFSYQFSSVFRVPRLILPTDWTWVTLILLAAGVAAAPWVFDGLLKQQGLQPFSLTQLEPHSPEASRLVRRVCGQQRRPFPTLKRLPIAAPLLFSYGNSPQTARIVVSQGLLDQLQEDEIAALLAAELAHIHYWDFSVMSTILLTAQLPYWVYWQVAAWGDRQRDRVLKTVAVVISSLGYGLFWLLRLPGLWLSRVRLYYSDRWAADLTGNPNGLARALLKIAIGTAETIQQQQQTSGLLESFELLSPVGYRNGIALGSVYATGDQEKNAALFTWDQTNPRRRWLVLNNTHPLLGERLALLMKYAQQWRLEPELDWQHHQQPKPGLQRFLLQIAPFVGVPCGAVVAVALWGLGIGARRLRWFELGWLADQPSLLLACCLLGFSIGMFLRINPFFPDIKRSNSLINPALPELLADPNVLPIDSQPVQIQGTLIGRKGFQNWLYQDLMLQTASGLIRLHYTSNLGWIGDLFPKEIRPTAVLNRAVTVTGWFRRGATPWIDVDLIRTEYGRTLRSHHPVWSTVLAVAAALYAIYLIVWGG